MSDDATVAASVASDATMAAGNAGTASVPGRAVGAVRTTTHFVSGRELARGGMGRVIVAQDQRLGRTVALKLLQRVSPTLRARFEREALITAQLAHPAIIPIYEAGELAGGEPFYAMKLVDGTPLDATIAAARDLRARLALLSSAMAVCEALAYAHSKRIIHRDLKPANVLVGKFGETVVIDWGLAKDLTAPTTDDSLAPREPVDATADTGPRPLPEASGAQGLTLDGEVFGTPSYMPPEQALGDGVDERADVYALGALLYHVVAGHPPYRGRTAAEILAAVEAGPPPPIAEVEPAVPDDLASIIGKAMARAPSARYPSAGELAEELRRFIDGRLVASHRYSGADLLRRWLRRHRTAVAVGAVALGMLAVGGIVSVRQIVAREHATQRALADSRLEQARQLVVAGAASQAAPYLAAVREVLPDDPLAQRLTASALRDAPRRLGEFTGTAAAFRPDGRELAIAGTDGVITRVDPATRATLGTLTPGGVITALEYAADGTRLAVASTAGAWLCEPAGQACAPLPGVAAATELRFLPRGGGLVIASADSLSLFDPGGKRVADDHPVPTPRALAVSADGATIVAITAGDGVIAWRAADLTRVLELPAGGPARYSATFDHGDLLTAGPDGLRRWHAADQASTVATDAVVSLIWLDEQTLLAGGNVVRMDTGEVRLIARDSIQVAAMIDRTHVILGGYDHTLRVWDLERPARPSVVLDAARAVGTIVVDPVGHRAVSIGRDRDTHIELWDLADLPGPTRTAALGARVDRIVSDHYERLALHVDADKSDTPTTRLLTTAFDLVATVDGWPLGFRPDGDELVTIRDGTLAVYSARDGKHLRDVPEVPGAWRFVFSASGASAAASSEKSVTVFDAAWHVTAHFDATAAVTALAIDDLGRVVVGAQSGAVEIWNTRGPTLLATLRGHAAEISDVEIRGDALVTNSWDQSTRRWTFPAGEPDGILIGFDRRANDIELSPGGALGADTDGSSLATVWESAQGRVVRELATSEGLTSAAFIDDEHLVVGGLTGHLELLDLAESVRSPADVTRLLGASRWELVGGRAVESR